MGGSLIVVSHQIGNSVCHVLCTLPKRGQTLVDRELLPELDVLNKVLLILILEKVTVVRPALPGSHFGLPRL